MSNKRPLSPELTNGLTNDNNKNNSNNIRSLKRFKLHSIIEELRNEEANLVLLKKLRASQQLINRTHTSNHSNTNTNNHISTKTTTTTNGFHSSTATRVLSTNKSSVLPPSSIKSIPQAIPSSAVAAAARKPANSMNPSLTSKVPTALPQKSSSSTLASIEERKTQAKKALRSQLERDLLNIPAPKPLLQDVSFSPNPASLEFQPFIGLEDVVQCLYELQMDRQRLPQRLTDRAQVDEPFVCEQCGTDFTIRWWKHLNSNQQTNILCDRCKKQVTRRTLKSEHSALLKNVFISAMEQEKEIEKTFQVLIKQQQQIQEQQLKQQQQQIQQQQQQQQKVASRSPQMTTKSIPSYNPNSQNQKPKSKPSSIPQMQNFATKLSQQPTNATRKSNVAIPSSSSAPLHRSISHQKAPLPAHQQQQQYRSSTGLPHQSSKSNHATKMPKPVVRQQAQSSSLLSSRSLIPPTTGLIPPLTLHPAIPPSAHHGRPTATKRRTLPPVNMK